MVGSSDGITAGFHRRAAPPVGRSTDTRAVGRSTAVPARPVQTIVGRRVLER